MKAFKIAASAALCLALLAAGVAAEFLALMRYTVLNPMFYGSTEAGAYTLVGQVLVRRLSDGVLDRVPAIALRTSDRERAYMLAGQALPPRKVAQMLQDGGPYVALYLMNGGDIPTLQGSEGLDAEAQAAVKNLVMDDFSGQVGQAVKLGAYLPFTPAWNAEYGATLTQSLGVPRYWGRLEVYMFAAACAAAVVLAGLLYLLWVRERKPFFRLCGGLLAANGLLLLVLAATVSFGIDGIARAFAGIPALAGAVSLFDADWQALVRAVLWPFRSIFFVGAVASVSLSVAMLFAGAAHAEPARQSVFGQAARHRRPWNEKPAPEKAKGPMLEPVILNEVEEGLPVREPKHKKKGRG